MSGAHFAPGPATAYVSDGVLAMTLDAGVDAEVMARCAGAVEWSDLFAVFAGRTDAAVVRQAGDDVRAALIGAVEVGFDGPDGAHDISGGPTWTTHEISSARAVSIRCAGEPDAELSHCVEAGTVPAARVVRRLVPVDGPAPDPFESLFGDTAARTVESAAVRADVDVGSFPSVPLGVLVFSSGDRVVVDRTMVLGRNPRTCDEADPQTGMRRVRIAAAGVSRRHAMIRVDRWHASIDDLGSSNGTRVTAPGGSPLPVEPGQPVDLVPGSVVDLGGDVSFAVEEVA